MVDLVVCVLLTCRPIVKSSNSIRQFLQLIQRNIHKEESFLILSVIKVTETIKYIKKKKLHDKKKVKMVHTFRGLRACHWDSTPNLHLKR